MTVCKQTELGFQKLLFKTDTQNLVSLVMRLASCRRGQRASLHEVAFQWKTRKKLYTPMGRRGFLADRCWTAV